MGLSSFGRWIYGRHILERNNMESSCQNYLSDSIVSLLCKICTIAIQVKEICDSQY